jgi:hypothetical protein
LTPLVNIIQYLYPIPQGEVRILFQCRETLSVCISLQPGRWG